MRSVFFTEKLAVFVSLQAETGKESLLNFSLYFAGSF
jgi:hypothetical protein